MAEPSRSRETGLSNETPTPLSHSTTHVKEHPYYSAWLNGGDLTPPLHIRDDIDLDSLSCHRFFLLYGENHHYNRYLDSILAAVKLDELTYQNICTILECVSAKYLNGLCSQRQDGMPVYLPVSIPHTFKDLNPVCHMAIQACDSWQEEKSPPDFFFCFLDCHPIDPYVKTAVYDKYNEYEFSRITSTVPDEVVDIFRRAENLAKRCRKEINRNSNFPPAERQPNSRSPKNDRTNQWRLFVSVSDTNLCTLDKKTLKDLFRLTLKEVEKRKFVTFESDIEISKIVNTWLGSYTQKTEPTIIGNPEGLRDLCVFAISAIKEKKVVSNQVLSRKIIIDIVRNILPNTPQVKSPSNVNRIVDKVTGFLGCQVPS